MKNKKYTDTEKMIFFLEWLNDFLSIERFAHYKGISKQQCEKIILDGKYLYNLESN